MAESKDGLARLLEIADAIEAIGETINENIEDAIGYLKELDDGEYGTGDTVARAMAYWVAIIMGNLGNKYFGEGSMVNLDETVDELREAAALRGGVNGI